jgi:hypothetical protein
MKKSKKILLGLVAVFIIGAIASTRCFKEKERKMSNKTKNGANSLFAMLLETLQESKELREKLQERLKDMDDEEKQRSDQASA